MKSYRDHIQERDKHTCQMCGSHEYLEVHHIEKRTDGLKSHSYLLLITLCHKCHINKVHITTVSHKDYIERFEQYTSQFTEPTNWQLIVRITIIDDKKKSKKIAKKKYLKTKKVAKQIKDGTYERPKPNYKHSDLFLIDL